MFKCIIAGSRNFTDYSKLCEFIELCPWKDKITTIISGAANGADYLGEIYAKDNNLLIERCPADWSKGRGAGIARNIVMADKADALIAIHMNESKGTQHMIDIATQRGLRLWVLKLDTDTSKTNKPRNVKGL
jgi:hypothetical protein